jgi:hypothetical protein
MKKIILSLLLFSLLSCKAQTPVLSLYDDVLIDIQDAYYKDITGFHDQFVGRWLYTNGTTILEVVLLEKEMMYNNVGPKPSYEDCLIGGSRYVENGVEKYNTIPTIYEERETVYDYFMWNMSKVPSSGFPKCNDCAANEYRLSMDYDEPLTKSDKCLRAEFVMRHVVENGVEKIKVQFVKMSGSCGPSYDGPTVVGLNYALPYAEYTLIKQSN